MVFLLGVLEVGTRRFVDIEELSPTPVRDVDPDNRLAFLPGRTRTYESSEFTFTVSFNQHGRRDVEWSDDTLADPRNILFVGDSLVLGNAVDFEWTMPTLLEKRIAAIESPREVYNFGMPGGGPPQYRQMMEDAFDAGFAAQVVLVGIFIGNDFYPIVQRPWGMQHRPRPPPKQQGSALYRFLRRRVAQSPRTVGWALTIGRLTGLPVYNTSGSYVYLRKQTEKQVALFEDILSHIGKMKEACEATGRELYAVLIPNKIQVENTSELTNDIFDAAKPNRLISEYCAEIGIRCLDLLPVMAAAHERELGPLYYPIDRHFTPTGYSLAADAIFDFLVQSGALPRS